MHCILTYVEILIINVQQHITVIIKFASKEQSKASYSMCLTEEEIQYKEIQYSVFS